MLLTILVLVVAAALAQQNDGWDNGNAFVGVNATTIVVVLERGTMRGRGIIPPTYSFQDTAVHKPNGCSGSKQWMGFSTTGIDCRVVVIRFTKETSGPLQVAVTPTNFIPKDAFRYDVQLHLHCSNTDPVTPLENLRAFSEDSGFDMMPAFAPEDRVEVQGGVEYFLSVVTTRPAEADKYRDPGVEFEITFAGGNYQAAVLDWRAMTQCSGVSPDLLNEALCSDGKFTTFNDRCYLNSGSYECMGYTTPHPICADESSDGKPCINQTHYCHSGECLQVSASTVEQCKKTNGRLPVASTDVTTATCNDGNDDTMYDTCGGFPVQRTLECRGLLIMPQCRDADSNPLILGSACTTIATSTTESSTGYCYYGIRDGNVVLECLPRSSSVGLNNINSSRPIKDCVDEAGYALPERTPCYLGNKYLQYECVLGACLPYFVEDQCRDTDGTFIAGKHCDDGSSATLNDLCIREGQTSAWHGICRGVAYDSRCVTNNQLTTEGWGCDDNDSRTVLDKCVYTDRFTMVCIGEPLVAPDCLVEGAVVEGKSCNDGDEFSFRDKCSSSGECKGTRASISCYDIKQEKEKKEGDACDDDNNHSTGDTCQLQGSMLLCLGEFRELGAYTIVATFAPLLILEGALIKIVSGRIERMGMCAVYCSQEEFCVSWQWKLTSAECTLTSSTLSTDTSAFRSAVATANTNVSMHAISASSTGSLVYSGMLTTSVPKPTLPRPYSRASSNYSCPWLQCMAVLLLCAQLLS